MDLPDPIMPMRTMRSIGGSLTSNGMDAGRATGRSRVPSRFEGSGCQLGQAPVLRQAASIADCVPATSRLVTKRLIASVIGWRNAGSVAGPGAIP